MSRWLVAVLALSWIAVPGAAPDYRLSARPIVPDVWVFEGLQQHFSRDNGGNIANTGFIVGDDGVVVIDTGPSRLYGEQMRAVIAHKAGDKPIRRVFITHAHPDHFLGNQAFADTPVQALAPTAAAIAQQGDALSANLYRLVGGWMQGTEVHAPDAIEQTGPVQLAGRSLRLIGLRGHTSADLAIYDEASRTLFTGDLVFHQRAATTPNADIVAWLKALDELQRIDYAHLVPGHGPAVGGPAAIAETQDYLNWLQQSLQSAASQGLDMVEVMRSPIPERFRKLAVVDEEHARSVNHLYPALENEALVPAQRISP